VLECGAPADAHDYDQRTPLHIAAAEGNLPCVRVLLGARADASRLDRWGATPLSDALRAGHTGEVASVLHAAGAKLLTSRAAAANQLCDLAAAGMVERVSTLVALGADVNAANVDGRTALHVAAAEAHKSTCACLIDAGADPKLRDRWGRTPLDEAQQSGLAAVFDLAACLSGSPPRLAEPDLDRAVSPSGCRTSKPLDRS